MSKTITSGTITFMDTTDDRKLEVYITSNHPTAQIKNQNLEEYTPDWSTTNLKLSAKIYLDSKDVTADTQTDIGWYTKIGPTETLVGTGASLTISTNALDTNPIITYICKAEYQNVDALSQITFTRVDTGLNGSDGTSVKIKGTATSTTKVVDTDYYTLTYSGSEVSTAELNDAYIYNGDLYVCVDSRDGVDYFINVGRIQGPAGENAKNIVLSGSAQVFKISKTNVYTPATIAVTAHTFNTSATIWTYSVNGGQTFLSTVPTGVVRNGNVVTITGSTLISNSIVVKASDGTVEDVFTIYKAFDGTDGSAGTPGAPAPLVFLTNENISFAANASGQIATTAFTTNVVAYSGTTKVTPTIGAITSLPTGMTVSAPVTTANEQILTFSISNNSTLGSASSNNGTITIPVTSPVSTNLKLSWSKINTGATGTGIKSTTVTYGASGSSSVQPTVWQSTIPTVAEGSYLWTRTVTDYTDDAVADTVTLTYAKQGVKGDTGSAGSSVTVSSIQYQAGTSAITAPTGTWSNNVVSVADGSYLWTKTTFSDGKVAYGVAKQGSAGTPASLVKITPSALYFKSTTGKDGAFTPDYIYLYPRFQTATYSSWHYSVDGGTTWANASGANGLTIGTYNAVANSLRISRGSTLYTDTITSISFRCNSSNGAVYDIVSITKIYDVVDLQVGSRNLARFTNSNYWQSYLTSSIGFSDGDRSKRIKVQCTANEDTPSSFFGVQQSPPARLMKLQPNQKYTLSFRVRGNVSNLSYTYLMNSGSPNMTIGSIELPTISETDFVKVSKTFTAMNNVAASTGSYLMLSYFGPKTTSMWFEIEEIQLEAGNVATDWTPAPEDLIEEASNINVMLSNESHLFEATAGGVPTETSITLDVVGYKGSILSTTTVGRITGLPTTGMTATILNNGTANTRILIEITSALTSDIADYGSLTIPVTVNGKTINKMFSWSKAKAGEIGTAGVDAVTFQVYSSNGYALSTNTQTITLQTFAYVGDVEITAGATYQWYSYNDGWSAISGETAPYMDVSRDDISFSKSYMCKMEFNGLEYTGVVTIDDKNDTNKVFSVKPSNYTAGDLWIVGTDYVPGGVEIGTLLRAEHTNATYEDSDWITATKYDEKIDALQNNIDEYNQYFSFDSQTGLRISARDVSGNASQFSTTLSNERLSFNQGTEAVAYIESNKMKIKEAEIISPLTVTGQYSGSTMLQAPIINIGNFSIVVESNGSLSIIANT